MCFSLVFYGFVLFVFWAGGVLELLWLSLTAVFVRAKTSRHFSGAPVYIFSVCFCYNNYYYYYYDYYLYF